MRRLAAVVVCALALGGAGRVASAQVDASARAEISPGPGAGPGAVEAGLFAGGFISNYFHQFYDDRIQNREELNRVSPLLGLRLAYFPHRMVGAEGEASYTMARTKVSDGSAPILGLRVHVVAQYPGRITPFAVAGLGMARVSSAGDVLGSDSDFPLHIGGGARYLVGKSIAVRAELRFIRGPSAKDPYTLDASYGELMIGVSFDPMVLRRRRSTPVEPEPEPDLDPDDDGIRGSLDDCPDQAGVAPDGCPAKEPVVVGPPADADDDGIADAEDKCPTEPEDMDGHADRDGCDDPDNDSDGIPDVIDQCAIQAETINGNRDDDGCPDAGDSLVMLMPAHIEVFEPVRFRNDTAQILPKSRSLLGQVAATLRANRDIVHLRIVVHVQARSRRDLALSKERAAAVRTWLVEWGIEPERLQSAGRGSAQPLVPPRSKGAKEINDRVEFVILEKAITGSP